MKEKENKTNKGITLIALVITIVVLLILAAVSITALTGKNGILTQANHAKDNSIISQEKEQVELSYSSAMGKIRRKCRSNRFTSRIRFNSRGKQNISN